MGKITPEKLARIIEFHSTGGVIGMYLRHLEEKGISPNPVDSNRTVDLADRQPAAEIPGEPNHNEYNTSRYMDSHLLNLERKVRGEGKPDNNLRTDPDPLFLQALRDEIETRGLRPLPPYKGK